MWVDKSRSWARLRRTRARTGEGGGEEDAGAQAEELGGQE